MKFFELFSQKWEAFRADPEAIFEKIDNGMEAAWQFGAEVVRDFTSSDYKPLERSGPKELVGIKAWGADDIKAAREEGKRNRAEALQTARHEALEAFSQSTGGHIMGPAEEIKHIAKGTIPTADGHERPVNRGFSKAEMN